MPFVSTLTGKQGLAMAQNAKLAERRKDGHENGDGHGRTNGHRGQPTINVVSWTHVNKRDKTLTVTQQVDGTRFEKNRQGNFSSTATRDSNAWLNR